MLPIARRGIQVARLSLTGERPQQIEAIFCSAFFPQSAKNFARFTFFARLRFHPPCICSRGLNLCAKGARELCFSYAQKILSLPSLNCGDCCGITFAPDSAARNPSGATVRLTGERPQQIEAIFCSAFSPQSAKNFARFTFFARLAEFFFFMRRSIRPVELGRCGGGFGGSLTHSDFSDFLPQASPQIDNKKLRTPCAPDCVFYNRYRPAAPELMPAKGIFVGPRGSMGWRNLWAGRNPWRREDFSSFRRGAGKENFLRGGLCAG